ncbi:protein FAR-RED ELONGATED HYPOCOTYL 3-like [Olea europaea var. sylvestris]|uniref:protein FAR-RED ELONGATED HYPOCOTYL 3-like n=1 Tax=Olea europaea var. sylvestris TaxID=158386 RepID=UPI000C1D0C7B|nr:protein FAR-RED ELONGATED HYPOCOTYL 3-like [Olea europaea var. sylvestris]
MSKFEDLNIIYRPSNIQNYIRREFGIDRNYYKAWMARDCVIELLRGSPDLSYDRLAEYCNILKKNNPGTVTFIEVDNENRFKYFFMALGPSIRGFHSSMRHVIFVDGTFMKSKFRGTLPVAMCQDANFQIYPLAFGIVDSENDASWTWFFDKLFQVTGILEGLVFISDHKDSIGNAIKIVYPNAHHGCCMWYLQLNIKSNYHKANILPLFMATAKEYSLINFEKLMTNLYRKSPAVGQYLENKVGYEFWSRAHFKGVRYNIMTTNNAESLNSLFKNAREFPVLAMVEQIRKTLQK